MKPIEIKDKVKNPDVTNESPNRIGMVTKIELWKQTVDNIKNDIVMVEVLYRDYEQKYTYNYIQYHIL
jgi:hypothetical protein